MKTFQEMKPEMSSTKFEEPGEQLQCINDKYQTYSFPILDVI